MLLDDPLRAFSFVCALVKYTKLTRELLGICHGHLSNQKTTVKATQSIVQAVMYALSVVEEEEEEGGQEEEKEEEEEKPKPEVKKAPPALVKKPVKETKPSASTEQALAADPAGIMRRAVGRGVGDGSAVLQIMNKFPMDARIQSHGVRALKGVIRSVGHAAYAESKQFGNQKSDSMSIQTVIDKMKQFPDSLTLQRDGLLCLAEIVNQADEYILIITSSGGISSLIDAMVALPDDVPANMAGLSLLAHPKITVGASCYQL
eukprot:jgi/Phyca11/22019/fgenesh1_pg.PHYCAscaffold_408_\